MKIDISLIILNFNTKKLLKNLIESIYKSKLNGIKIEIIVVDNASIDGSQEYLKSIKKDLNLKTIFNKKNIGYSQGNNKGAKQANGRYLLFLNSDTLLLKDTLIKMVSFMDENNQYSAATCRLELPTGKLDLACHRGFPTPWAAFTYFIGLERLFPNSKDFSQYHQGWKNLKKPHQVDVISGAFFMIRNEDFKKAKMFDEDYFIYGEDIDLCYKLNQLGKKACFYPETKIIHYKKQSGRDIKRTSKDNNEIEIKKKTKKHFFKTMSTFYNKHYQDKYPWITRTLVLAGIFIISKFKE